MAMAEGAEKQMRKAVADLDTRAAARRKQRPNTPQHAWQRAEKVVAARTVTPCTTIDMASVYAKDNAGAVLRPSRSGRVRRLMAYGVVCPQ